MSDNWVFYFHQEHAARCDPKDFWGQVRRTVNGKPVGEDQIRMIVDAILSGLRIEKIDFVLDLCCGNGALTDRIFEKCQGGVGVDFCDYLIKVALDNFEQPPSRTYILQDVEQFLASSEEVGRFTKALCYGSFQHFSPEKAYRVLAALRARFPRIRDFFIGNLPDRASIDTFPNMINDAAAPFGVWRTEGEFAELAAAAGWQPRFYRMPAAFYGAHYRYDVLLTPIAPG